MSKKAYEFQAETKQLLDLMIHSIYTNKDIFLRELISNASDALDKLHFEALTNPDLIPAGYTPEITLIPDTDKHTLTICDNGIGMNREELIDNIGTIAKSGTKTFLTKLKEAKENNSTLTDKDMIGQFGVGFYSAFMAAKNVTILTRKAGESQGYKWESIGDGSFTVEECDKAEPGAEICLKLLPEFYGAKAEADFTQSSTLQRLVKKYSDYVRYPVKTTFITEETPKDEEGKPIEGAEKIKHEEIRTLNSMQPLWVKSKKDITPEEYSEFFKNIFHDWEASLDVLHIKAEGTLEYTALLFIPSHAPYNLYHTDYEPGLQLYSRHVFIMNKCKDLLPDYLRFVQGLVDSPDLSLNISRELLQQDRQLQTIGKNLEKKVLDTLSKMLKTDRPKYEKFWQEFGKSLKMGVYNSMYYGENTTDKLKELLLFASSQAENSLTSLAEYTARMPETQKQIYYATGKDRATIERLPQMELLRDKGLEVLYLFDPVDEFALEALHEYTGHHFHSVSRGDLELDDDSSKESKQKAEDATKANESLLDDIKTQLNDKVTAVHISSRLKSGAVCLVSAAEGPSLSMEKVFAATDTPMFKAQRILEINPDHPLFARLQSLHEKGRDSSDFAAFCTLLYDQALLVEGILPEDPIDFANKVANLMAK